MKKSNHSAKPGNAGRFGAQAKPGSGSPTNFTEGDPFAYMDREAGRGMAKECRELNEGGTPISPAQKPSKKTT